jgi:uncharacterized protein (DUF1501 family)
MIGRREFLKSTTATAFLAGYPIAGFTQDLPPGRICLIILEGGMDGLTCVAPIGDQNLLRARRGLLINRALELNPFFALHPSLKSFAEMLSADEAAIVHATAFPYTRRSHFEGQNIVEAGVLTPFSSNTGWLGRAMDIAGIAGRALSLDTPLVIRGATGLDSFYPASLAGSRGADQNLLALMTSVHGAEVSNVLESLSGQLQQLEDAPRVRDPAGLALAAGKAMQLENGPRVAVIRVNEFDTHANQGTDEGRHATQLKIVDQVFANFKRGLGDKWSDTVILTATEFGRTVSQNGSSGTDHGYGSVGLIAGGLLNKSSILADWPGLATKDLFENRDLQSTLDYRAVCAACIERALGLSHDVISDRVFFEPALERVHDLIFT